jgi:hypothetical protein
VGLFFNHSSLESESNIDRGGAVFRIAGKLTSKVIGLPDFRQPIVITRTGDEPIDINAYSTGETIVEPIKIINVNIFYSFNVPSSFMSFMLLDARKATYGPAWMLKFFPMWKTPNTGISR